MVQIFFAYTFMKYHIFRKHKNSSNATLFKVFLFTTGKTFLKIGFFQVVDWKGMQKVPNFIGNYCWASHTQSWPIGMTSCCCTGIKNLTHPFSILSVLLFVFLCPPSYHQIHHRQTLFHIPIQYDCCPLNLL